MLFFKQLLVFLVKLTLVTLIISFEKVIGLPLVFFTLVLVFVLKEKTFSRYLILGLSSLILAIVYRIPITLSAGLFSVCYLLFLYGHGLVENNFQRIMFLILSSLLIIAISSSVVLTFDVGIYFIISLLISAYLIFKILLIKYGFLGNQFNSKSSFFK